MNQPDKKYDPSTFSLWDNYAPAMGQKAPENTQSYNRYAYCLNNPMKYTDPSGYRYGQPTVMIDGLIEWHGDAQTYIRTHGANTDVISYNGYDIYNSNKGHWEEVREKASYTSGEETIRSLIYMQDQNIEDFNLSDYYFVGGPGDGLKFGYSVNNLATYSSTVSGAFQYSIFVKNSHFLNLKQLQFYRIQPGYGRVLTNELQLAKVSSVKFGNFGKGCFYINAAFSGFNIINGISNGDSKKVLWSSLSLGYSALATYGDPVGMFLSTPYCLIDATIGLDNFYNYQTNYLNERASRIANGDYSLLWYRPGMSVR